MVKKVAEKAPKARTITTTAKAGKSDPVRWREDAVFKEILG
jgi:hypothetical protein